MIVPVQRSTQDLTACGFRNSHALSTEEQHSSLNGYRDPVTAELTSRVALSMSPEGGFKLIPSRAIAGGLNHSATTSLLFS